MYAYIVIIITTLAFLTSCSTDWEINTMPMITKQPVPGQPYEVPPLPEGGGMLHPNPLLLFDEYILASAPKAIPVEAY